MLGSAAPEGLCLEPEQPPPQGEVHQRHDVSRGRRTGLGRAAALKEFLDGFGKGVARRNGLRRLLGRGRVCRLGRGAFLGRELCHQTEELRLPGKHVSLLRGDKKV